MNGFIKGVLNKPVTVVVTIIALAVFFVTAISSITLKLMPDMSIPVMAVYTVYPGASPEEVDELVSDKISSACETLSGLKLVSCRSSENLSLVILQYEYGKDMDKAYNDVKVAVEAKKSELPDEVKDPTILEIDTNAIDDITLSVTGVTDNVDVLSEVNDYVEPELRKVSTLAQVNISGGDEKYIRVQVIPEYLTQYGLDLTGIASAIGAANFSMPAGNADYGDQSIALSAEVKYDTVPEIEQIPITTSRGQTIHLNDIATVQYAISDKSSLSRYMGRDNVSVGLRRRQSASSVTLSRQVRPVLDDLRAKHPELNIEIVEDMADTITDTLKGVAKTVVEAVLLAMVIIFIFFGDIKGSLIVGSTMPVSIMATVICMYYAGFALDIITMGALIIAVGMMTDNAVVVIEMCFREHQAGLSFKDAAYEGTTIVGNAVVGSTLTTVVVYVPLALMEGLSGQMFKPLGATIIFALLASLISALTLIPLCFAVYKPVEKREIITNRILRKVIKVYRKILRFALKWKKSIFFVAVIVLVITVFLAQFLKTELFSGTDEGIVQVSVNFRPNLNLETMDGTVRQVEDFVASSEVIENYSTTIDKTGATATISAYKLDDTGMSTQDIVDDWNLKLNNFSAMCEIKVSAGSTMGTGQLSAVNTQEYDITSADIDKLKATSKQIMDIMEDTDGVLYASSNFSDTGSKAMVEIDPVMAIAKGFSAQQLAGLVYNNMSGKKATDVTIDNIKYEVTVKYPEDFYRNISDVQAMTFTNAQGVTVPLSEVGTVRFTSAPQTMVRQDGLYVDQIVATMTADTHDEVVAKLQERLDEYKMDEDVRYLDDTVSRMMTEEFSALGQAIFIAIFLVFFVMTVQFESIADSLLIMMCLPFAGVGSILFLLLADIKISMVSLMGVLMLSGIVVNNGIILIDMAIQNQRAGMNTVDALMDAGTGRLRPILMTTLTTVIAMIPVAFGWSEDTASMQGMAGVIVGGLSVSMVLTLVLLPTFYLLLDRARAKI
ncbi:MAG: efflux RND transporter permease subunit, partial [Lachnospiraceae bacterium]|nr:efflux RND transporter permease subunit [Lachnospiraceae bacterium]